MCFTSFFTCVKPPCSFVMRLPNHLDCSTEVLFAKAFLFTPGRTRGFVMPKGNKKPPPSPKGTAAAVCGSEGTYKPSSVVNSHLSWPDVAVAAHATFSGTRRAERSHVPSAVLLRIGFAEPHGLPCAGELLPRLSTLTVRRHGGISLLHFPWGRPRRPLAVILALWSSDFPQTRPFGTAPAAVQPARFSYCT